MLPKRKENHSPMSDEIIAKKKNTSKSALDETITTNNTSTLSNDITDSTNTPKKNEKRYRVCHEVLDTEENYVRVLRILLENFKKPLEARIRNGEERELLSQNDMYILFHKIGKLFDVHSYILQNLRKNINDWQNSNLIGKIWADSFHDLQKCYPSYINGYDGILRTLDNLNSNRPAFHEFIKNAESDPECQKNSLRDLLIRPVQRIPSVLLLLQELLKRTEKNNPDCPFVKEAIINLKKVLEVTNEARRKTDNYQHFMEITNDIEDIPNEIISASTRHFIQSIDVVVISAGGILHKYKGKKIGLFLFNDIVEVAKARFCTSELNSTLGTSNGGSGLNNSFNSGSSTSTLNRQLSMGVLRRNASWKKQRQRYKHITLFRFANFRSIELEKENEVFIVKIRDQKADELCFFKPINGYTLDIAIDFFDNLVQAIVSTSTREICLEEVTFKQIREQGHASPEDVETIAKALNIARELDKTGTISRRNSLRRSISSISLNPWHPLIRMGSIKKPTLGDISES